MADPLPWTMLFVATPMMPRGAYLPFRIGLVFCKLGLVVIQIRK